MRNRGPLPEYFQASLTELHADRAGLPGVADSGQWGQPDVLTAAEVLDIHLPLSLAEAVVGAACPPGGRVLDPFAGYGTTLLASENLGRRAVGVELLPEHLAICGERAPGSHIIEGDSRGLYQLVEGHFDLCFTAPPFRTANDHPADPLTGYELTGGTYESYLTELAGIAAQVAELLRPGAYVVMSAANLRYRGHTTRLAWDLAAAIDPVVPFVAETTIVWDSLPHDFTGDYLLTFQKPAAPEPAAAANPRGMMRP